MSLPLKDRCTTVWASRGDTTGRVVLYLKSPAVLSTKPITRDLQDRRTTTIVLTEHATRSSMTGLGYPSARTQLPCYTVPRASSVGNAPLQ